MDLPVFFVQGRVRGKHSRQGGQLIRGGDGVHQRTDQELPGGHAAERTVSCTDGTGSNPSGEEVGAAQTGW